ncbi:DUF5080 domain-containing protein [Mammaliicoccus vitulinus]|uniref:DUF5080 domain-containing protein n=1 Tax=Mammaliicoccus vitulinus TaxID=71237 RepID=A0A2T4PQN2_9STAP|nr:DUF5080 family protein [Mammaliicoccus vitulinus]PTI28151.1 DUF5080 domain-containing protein [Mammaliicoccus vitulinus]
MIIAVLVGLFIISYAVVLVSLMKAEGFSLFSLVIDILILASLIALYFIGGNMRGQDLSNFLMFTHLGSFIFMYFAIKSFWVKPKLLIYLVQKKENVDDEDLEFQELDFLTSRIKASYYFILAIVLLIITKLRMVPELKEDALSMNPVFIFIGIIIIFIWLIIDIYRKKKYGIFLFKTIVPLIVTIWIIIGTIIF